MDEHTSDEAESLNPQEDVTEATGEVTTTEEESETSQPDIEELQKRAALADDYKKRAEKAERQIKNAKQPVHSNDNDLSARDVAVLLQNNVPAEDFDEVVEAAKILKKPLSEALKSNVVKTLIAEKAEERKTAGLTQTKAPARGSSKVSGEDLLAKSERGGDLPDTDEGMAALVAARQARTIAYRKK